MGRDFFKAAAGAIFLSDGDACKIRFECPGLVSSEKSDGSVGRRARGTGSCPSSNFELASPFQLLLPLSPVRPPPGFLYQSVQQHTPCLVLVYPVEIGTLARGKVVHIWRARAGRVPAGSGGAASPWDLSSPSSSLSIDLRPSVRPFVGPPVPQQQQRRWSPLSGVVDQSRHPFYGWCPALNGIALFLSLVFFWADTGGASGGPLPAIKGFLPVPPPLHTLLQCGAASPWACE